MIISRCQEIEYVYMAKTGQATAKADFVTILFGPCHLKVKINRNVQNNIRNKFNVPTSVELEASHLHNTPNKQTK